MYRHPAVAEVGVVGVPDDYRGEDVLAFVVPRAGRDRDRGASWSRGAARRWRSTRRRARCGSCRPAEDRLGQDRQARAARAGARRHRVTGGRRRAPPTQRRRALRGRPAAPACGGRACRAPLGEHRRRLDLEQQIGPHELGDLDQGAGRATRPEVLLPDRVDLLAVGHVLEIDRHLAHVGEGGARRGQAALDVLVGLPGLGHDVAASHRVALVVASHAARDEHQPARADHVDEVADRLGHARHPDLFPVSSGHRCLLSCVGVEGSCRRGIMTPAVSRPPESVVRAEISSVFRGSHAGPTLADLAAHDQSTRRRRARRSPPPDLLRHPHPPAGARSGFRQRAREHAADAGRPGGAQPDHRH